MLKYLDFDMTTPTSVGFVKLIDQISPLTKQVKFFALFLCDMYLLSSELTCTQPASLIAFSAITLAHLALRVPMQEQKDLRQIFGNWYNAE